MFTIYNFILQVCFVIIVSIENTVLQNPLKSLNVIIFFTNTNNAPSSDKGIRFLKLHEMARVKHSTNLKSAENIIVQRNIQNCHELLGESLESLEHFCQNALGMKTVIKSVCTSSPVNNQFNIPQQIKQRQIKNKLYKSKKDRKQEDTIPSVTKIKNFNSDNIILSPEHTEIFKIRVKRNATSPDDESDRFNGESSRNLKDKPLWDVLDIISHIRFSFFGNLLEDERKQKLIKEGNDVLNNIDQHHIDESNLFETVRSTLLNLQETPCDAFLMVIFGGNLYEINDVHNPLIQSLKHVIESTDPDKTLLVVTGNCPDDKRVYNDVVVIKEDVKKFKNLSVFPVYAKGPNSEKLTQCTVLYDIPATIKNILEEISPTFENT